MAGRVVQPLKDIEDIRAIKEELRNTRNHQRNLLIFEIGLSTALRISDILQLRKKDVVGGVVRVKTQKTKVYRTIELNGRVSRMLLGYVEALKDDDVLFPITYKSVWKLFRQAAERAEIPDFATHSMRKTAAWHFYVRSGYDLRKTMYLLNHKETRETIAYLNLSDDEVNSVLVGMDLD